MSDITWHDGYVEPPPTNAGFLLIDGGDPAYGCTFHVVKYESGDWWIMPNWNVFDGMIKRWARIEDPS